MPLTDTEGTFKSGTGYCYDDDVLLSGPFPIENVNCTESNVCDVAENFLTGEGGTSLGNPACGDGESCFKPNVGQCEQPTAGTCTAFSKRTCSSLSDVQTRRLGKGLGKKRGWSETAEEENIPLN